MTTKVLRSRLDEDKPPVPNPDEVWVNVVLTALPPASPQSRSNVVTLNLP